MSHPYSSRSLMVRILGIASLLALVGLVPVFFHLAGCGSEAPTQLTVTLSSGQSLPQDISRILFHIKEEPSDASPRLVYEGQTAFTYSGDLSSAPLKVGFQPGDRFGGEVFLYVVVHGESGIMATGGGLYDLSKTADVAVTLQAYSATCDLDSDGFVACTDSQGADSGCCNHIPAEARTHLDDFEDDPEALAETYQAFEEAFPRMSCRDAFLSADQIHPFVAVGIEAAACFCSNGVDEDCDGGDYACPTADADGDGWVDLKDCNDNDNAVYPGAPESADNKDNDCDGLVDEVTCGYDWDSDGHCPPDDCNDLDPDINPDASEIPGNGIDEDCDGRDSMIQLDDDLDRDGYIDVAAWGDDCDDTDSGIFPGAPEPCGTGIDNNCDGSPTDCQDGDEDSDGFVDLDKGGDDCNDADPTIYPGGPEICEDGIDQDCDGLDNDCDDDWDDDGFPRPWDCNDWDETIHPYAVEYCDGLDNDCDGLVDEGNPLQFSVDDEAEPERCGGPNQVGECELGYTVCSERRGESIFVCAYEVTAIDELCDGLDNDCDGRTDEDDPEGGASCTVPERQGECAKGVQHCQEDGDGSLHCLGPNPSPEVCDGLDNDCDSYTDEDPDNPANPLTVPCYSGQEGTLGVGTCIGGTRTCSSGQLPETCAGEVIPAPETCANIGTDNDCDTVTDDIDNLGEDCATGEPGICATGTYVCNTSHLLVCQATNPVGVESCANMGTDDDCDGKLDNIVIPVDTTTASLGDPCDTGLDGECQDGFWQCEGETLSCVPIQQPDQVVEFCDGLDNDCDGTTDNVVVFNATGNQVAGAACRTNLPGICGAGTYACVQDPPTTGPWSFVCLPDQSTVAERCNHLDDDCDGLIDEEVLDTVSGDQVGDECTVAGELGVCAGGLVVCAYPDVDPDFALTCLQYVFATDTTANTAPETACNGLDDDCDGYTDEAVTGPGNPASLIDGDPYCGICGNVCITGRTCCAGVCINPDIDEANCGDCTITCGDNEECRLEDGEVTALCYCFDEPECNENEVCDPASGRCLCGDEIRCEDTESCVDDGESGFYCQCGAAESDSEHCLDGESCVEDAANPGEYICMCGEEDLCDRNGQECIEGACRCITGTDGDVYCVAQYGASFVCLEGECVNTNESTLACGATREVCAPDEECISGQCSCGVAGVRCQVYEVCYEDACHCGGSAGPVCVSPESCGPLGNCRCGTEASCSYGHECYISDGDPFCACGIEEPCPSGSRCCPDGDTRRCKSLYFWAFDYTFVGTEDGSFSIFPLSNDDNRCGDTLTATLVGTTPGFGGTLQLAEGGTHFRFDPDLNYNGTSYFTYQAHDTATTSIPRTVTLAVTPVNDAPVVIAGRTMDYWQGDLKKKIDEQIEVIDVDTGDMIVGAFVNITNCRTGEDVLAFAGYNGISTPVGWSWSCTNGLTLTGTASPSEYQAALRIVTYENLKSNPNNTDRIVQWTVNDGQVDSAAATSTIRVFDKNDAPLLTPSDPILTPINEDNTSSTGDTVATIVGDSIDDPDGAGSLEGIAIYDTTAVNGAWQYSTNAGGTWDPIGTFGTNEGLLLRAIDLVRFVPDEMNGGESLIYYYAWDQSGTTFGHQGEIWDITNKGGTYAFSSASDLATITVESVNDAPVLAEAWPTFATITEDDFSSEVQLVGTMVGETITDVDDGAKEGVAIYGTVEEYGGWQYLLDGEDTWTYFGAFTGTDALLLSSQDSIRFVPEGTMGGTSYLYYYAWDQTGTTIDYLGDKYELPLVLDPTSAFSQTDDEASIEVTDENDAPVLDPLWLATLDLISEDIDDLDNVGQSVASFVGTSITDPDGAALPWGIAIYELQEEYGGWQFLRQATGTWELIGTVAENGALLLDADDWIRFAPDGTNGGTSYLYYYAWDETGTGVEYEKVDVSVRGDTTPFSSANDDATIEVTDVNDAPVLAPVGPEFGAISENVVDASNYGQTVATLVGTSITDVDYGAVGGIAIYDLIEVYGGWQFRLHDGANWEFIGTFSGTDALLLAAEDWLRFDPDGTNGGTSYLYYYAWDQTGTTIDFVGTRYDLPAWDDTSAFSEDSDEAFIRVTDVNEPPTSAANTVTTDEDTTYVFMADDFEFHDEDAGDSLQGIQVTNLPELGTLYLGVNEVTAEQHISITDIENGDLSFTPDDDGYGTGYTDFPFKVSDGTNYSTAAYTMTIDVTAVNDAPVLTNTFDPELDGIDEDTARDDNEGNLVSFITGWDPTYITDDDSDPEGLAVIDVDDDFGTWEYFMVGTGWIPFLTDSVDPESFPVRLLAADSNTAIRFDPDDNFNGTATITFRAWDQTSPLGFEYVNGGTAYIASFGGTTPFSEATDTARITVASINDAPVLDADTYHPELTAIDEDPATNDGTKVSVITGVHIDYITDDDSDPEGLAITEVDNTNGTWEYSTDGSAWGTVFGLFYEQDPVRLLYADDTTAIRFNPDENFNGTATITFRAWDQTSVSPYVFENGGTAYVSSFGGTTPFSAATDTARITVNPVQDLPVAVDDDYETNQNTSLQVEAPGVLLNDSDPDVGDTITVYQFTPPSTGTLKDDTVNADGSFAYNPETDFCGTDTFTYNIIDSHGGTSPLSAEVMILVNCPPVAADDIDSTDEDTPKDIDVLYDDTDSDGHDLEITGVETSSTKGDVSFTASLVTYDPNGQFESLAVGETDTDTFGYTISDGHGGTDTATVTVTINGVNDAPVASPDQYSTPKNTTLNVTAAAGVLSNDSDVEEESMTASLVTDVAIGTLTLNSTGSFTFVPQPGSSTDVFFTYRACDTQSACSEPDTGTQVTIIVDGKDP